FSFLFLDFFCSIAVIVSILTFFFQFFFNVIDIIIIFFTHRLYLLFFLAEFCESFFKMVSAPLIIFILIPARARWRKQHCIARFCIMPGKLYPRSEERRVGKEERAPTEQE